MARRVLPVDITRALDGLCRQVRCTRFSALLAAINLLLHSCSGQEDQLVGAPASSRMHREMADVVGFFANTVVLRTRLHEDPSVAGLLAQCAATVIGAWRHVQFPFEHVLQALRVPREGATTPLIQVLLSEAESGQPDCDFGALRTTRLDRHPAEVVIDFEFRFQQLPSGLEVQAVYDVALFAQSTVEGLLVRLQRVLELMCRNPDERVSGLVRDPLFAVGNGSVAPAGSTNEEIDEP